MKPDYSSFKPLDFVLDDAFIRYALVRDSSSEAFWSDWLSENPDKRADFEEALVLIEAVRAGLTDYSRIHLSEEKEQQLLKRIRATNAEAAEKIKPLHPGIRWWKIAAVFMLISSIAVWFLKENFSSDSTGSYQAQIKSLNSPVIEHSNTSGNIQHFRLPDSTMVMLHPGSRLSYVVNFGEHDRKVILSGKAGFDVIRNPDLPFLVLTNAITTKVLGTVFEVDAFDEGQVVRVKVKSGKVSVFKNKDVSEEITETMPAKGVLLTSNQEVVYTRTSDKFDKKLVSSPEMILRESPATFQYEESPVAEVFAEIENAYGVNIIYDAETLKDCQLTSSLADEGLTEKLDIICKSIGLQYEIIETSIVITGKGCNKQ